ncbi:MAG TPA: PQQ-binding-like beta-propeller repeat protein, partial [Ktedonobacteraceae bacterium]
MTAHEEFFTPEEIDEQIELLSHGPAQGRATDAQAAQAISQLHDFYTREPEEHTPALERAWRRIVEEHQFAQQSSQKEGQPVSMQHYSRGQQQQSAHNNDRTSHKKRTFARQIGILAAVLFIGILIGSMALVLNAARQNAAPHTAQVKNNTHTASDGKPHPKPPHPITGGKCTLDTTVTHAQQSTSSVPGLYIFALNQQSDNLLYRYNTDTKQVVWSKKLCNAFESNGSIEHNGVLYLAGTDMTNEATTGSVSYLYALNESDGSVIWGVRFPASVIPQPVPKNLPENVAAQMRKSSPIDLGMIETPTFANGTVYVMQRSGIVYALDATNGGQLWTFNTGRNAWATTSEGGGSIVDPSSIQVVDGVAYGSIVDRLFALDAKSGAQLWMHSFHDALNINQAPFIANGTIYLTAFVPGYGTVMHPDTYIYAFDAQTGTQKWATPKLRGYINGPTALNGTAHALSYDGIWYTLKPSNGSIEAQTALSSSGV